MVAKTKSHNEDYKNTEISKIVLFVFSQVQHVAKLLRRHNKHKKHLDILDKQLILI